ncbi:MAG: hypothetical protein ACR2HV_03100 [Acidimicrobiales bacterium]
MATWPVTVVADDGRRVSVAAALGTGGERVAELLARIATAASPAPGLDIAGLARATPAGPVAAEVALVGFADAVEATARVDPAWLAAVDECRGAPRHRLEAAGRGIQLEAALHLAMLLATTPVEETDSLARVASGARLWLLGGAVAWALTGDPADPLSAWADLVSVGLWPVGPVGTRLVVGTPERPTMHTPGAPASVAAGS